LIKSLRKDILRADSFDSRRCTLSTDKSTSSLAFFHSPSFRCIVLCFTKCWYFLITDQPEIITHPQNVTTTAGENVTLYCDDNGNPAPTFSWNKDGSPVNTTANPRITFSADKKNLTITKVQKEDSGSQYQCVANNGIGQAVTSNTATLNIQYQPEFTTHPQNVTKTAGDNVGLSCDANGNPVPTFSWNKDGSPVNTSANPRITFSADKKQLIITNVNKADSGSQYQCVANNSIGQAITSNSASLNVQYQPEITTHPENVTATPGDNVTLSCDANGNPVPTLLWNKDGSPVNTTATPRITLSADKRQLAITNVDKADSGSRYQCVANNSIGQAITSNTASLNVQCKNNFTLYLVSIETKLVGIDAGK